MVLEKHHKIVNELEYLTLKNGYPVERLHELLGFEYSAKMREHFKKLDL